LRRIYTTVAILAALGGVAATALAATAGNTYTATYSFSPTQAGTAAHPVPISETFNYTAKNKNPQLLTEPIIEVKHVIYGVKTDGKDFAVCSLAFISAHGNNDAKCNPNALVATGYINATLSPNANKNAPHQIPCNPYLHVWNGGQGKVTYELTAPQNQTRCGGLHTGAATPYPGTMTQVGNNLVLDDKVGEADAFPVGLYAAVRYQHLVWAKKTKVVKGKTVAYQSSFACKNGQRPTSTTFTSEAKQRGQHHVVTINYSAKC